MLLKTIFQMLCKWVSMTVKYVTGILSSLLIASMHVSVSANSGDGDLLRPACVPPSNPPYKYNVTENTFNRLRQEGNCFFACIEKIIVSE